MGINGINGLTTNSVFGYSLIAPIKGVTPKVSTTSNPVATHPIDKVTPSNPVYTHPLDPAKPSNPVYTPLGTTANSLDVSA